jgi:hypothetical protein
MNILTMILYYNYKSNGEETLSVIKNILYGLVKKERRKSKWTHGMALLAAKGVKTNG